MDLKQLAYFVRVAELGSFTRAAIELDVAQPALSRQVRLLEVELRQTLLVRNGRGAVPTEAGKLLLDHGRGILHQVERAREDLGRLRGGLAGRVAVGLPSSVARVLTVPLTRAFREALPQARLSISEGLSGGLQEGLVSGRLDIVVLYNAQPSRELDLTPLLEEDLLLVRARPPGLHEDPPPGPISLQEVSQLPLVDLVLDGAGCAILSRNALLNTPRPSAYTAQHIGSPPLRIRLSLATSLQRPATPVQKATLELIRAKAPEVVAPAL
ncbi:MAG: LysR family transcriptional regulator [Ramlibacter sp.]|nr:LysR family transcriptional regulator [Ramlibacter sp.]